MIHVKVAEIYEQLCQRETALLVCILQFFWLAGNDQYFMIWRGPEHVQTSVVFIALLLFPLQASSQNFILLGTGHV